MDYPEVVASNFGDMRNVSVCGSIWFGTAPSEEDLELAKRRGVVRVINLSTSVDVSKCDVATVCGHLGLEYLMVPMGPADLGSDRCVDLVLDWLRGSDGRPTLMYDASGGRCASFLAIYRSAVLSVPLETALVEARRAGMKPGGPEEFVRAQVSRLMNSGSPAIGGAEVGTGLLN